MALKGQDQWKIGGERNRVGQGKGQDIRKITTQEARKCQGNTVKRLLLKIPASIYPLESLTEFLYKTLRMKGAPKLLGNGEIEQNRSICIFSVL